MGTITELGFQPDVVIFFSHAKEVKAKKWVDVITGEVTIDTPPVAPKPAPEVASKGMITFDPNHQPLPLAKEGLSLKLPKRKYKAKKRGPGPLHFAEPNEQRRQHLEAMGKEFLEQHKKELASLASIFTEKSVFGEFGKLEASKVEPKFIELIHQMEFKEKRPEGAWAPKHHGGKVSRIESLRIMEDSGPTPASYEIAVMVAPGETYQVTIEFLKFVIRDEVIVGAKWHGGKAGGQTLTRQIPWKIWRNAFWNRKDGPNLTAIWTNLLQPSFDKWVKGKYYS